MDFNQLWARYNETRQYKDRWLALYKDLYFYVLPDRDAFNIKWNYRDDGKPTTVQAWDTTAINAAYHRANDLGALLYPKDRVWGKFVLDPHLLSQDESSVSSASPKRTASRPMVLSPSITWPTRWRSWATTTTSSTVLYRSILAVFPWLKTTCSNPTASATSSFTETSSML